MLSYCATFALSTYLHKCAQHVHCSVCDTVVAAFQCLDDFIADL